MDLQLSQELGSLGFEGSLALFPHYGKLVLHLAVILESLIMSDTFGNQSPVFVLQTVLTALWYILAGGGYGLCVSVLPS